MGLSRYKLGDLIEISEAKNVDNKYSLSDVKGISIQKNFIDTKADMTNVSLKPYLIVSNLCFAYVPTTSRNGEKITLAFNDTSDTYIVSSSYIVFTVKKTNVLNPYFLFIFFNRPEFDRYSRFNSWGSARETFSWDEMCSIEIDLPDLLTQQKYVDVYNAMKQNQKSYETGLEDLKLTCDAYVDKIRNTVLKQPMGELLDEIDLRNNENLISDVQGININKSFMPSVANLTSTDLRKYKVINKNQFAYSSMQTGRDECIRIALYPKVEPAIISPAYSVLQVKTASVLPEWIMMWFSRKESDRYGWFKSDSSIRASLELVTFYEIEVPIPDINIQQAIVDIYTVYQQRKQINERLKAGIKDICPILIKGALEEGARGVAYELSATK